MNPFTEIKKNLPGNWCKGTLRKTIYKAKTGGKPVSYDRGVELADYDFYDRIELADQFCVLGHLREVANDGAVRQLRSGSSRRQRRQEVYVATRMLDEATRMLDETAREMFPERVATAVYASINGVAPGIEPSTQSGGKRVASVNDHPDTTEADMLAIVEKCEAKWDEHVW